MTVPFEFVHDHLVVVPVTVAGRPARFALDTGAGIDVLSPRLAEGLGLAPRGRFTGRRMTGEELKGRHFMQEYGGTDKPWEFKPLKRDEVLASLKQARERVDEVLSWPANALAEPTEAVEKAHAERIKALRDAGEDTSEQEAAGPPTSEAPARDALPANDMAPLVVHDQ